MNFIKIYIYVANSGKQPFYDWQNKLDCNTRAIVRSRLDRVRLGNLGDCKPIKNGNGVWELRISFGPGYRIYFGKIENKVVVLLCAGNKGSQSRDIEKAKQYWHECKELTYE
jgi:putative addiction module killer protein